MTDWTWLDRAQWFCVALECMLKSPRWVSWLTFIGTTDPGVALRSGARCNVASAATLGHYACALEQGHAGKCVAMAEVRKGEG